jgi:hypothetical protein
MIYVEEKEFKRQIDLLYFLTEKQEYKICAWLYPESNVEEVAGFKVLSNKSLIEPITTYANGFLPHHTELVLVTKEIIKSFSSSKSELEANCDSLALYKPGATYWAAATVGHEGMCLVRQTDLLSSLVCSGFKASKDAPVWW